MSTEELTIIVLGVVGVLALGVFAYYGKKLAEIAGLLQPLIEVIVGRADVALAGYGPVLKPAHEAVTALSTLVDEDDDTLVRELPENVVAAARILLEYAGQLTDGVAEPPQETLDERAGDEAVPR